MDKIKQDNAASGIIVANDLRTGLTVFLTAGGEWAEQVAAAWIVPSEHRERAMQVAAEAESRNSVTGVYLTECDDLGRPLTLRERLRIKGPSVDYLPQHSVESTGGTLQLQAGT
jgi:hypothetical protein